MFKKILRIGLYTLALGFMVTPAAAIADEITVSGNGEGSNSSVNVNSNNSTNVNQTNDAQVDNDVAVDADTG